MNATGDCIEYTITEQCSTYLHRIGGAEVQEEKFDITHFLSYIK